MKTVRKTLLDKFQEHLQMAYSLYCEKHELNMDRERFLTFLIDQELIPFNQIRRFAILKEFEKQKVTMNNKTQTIKKLAEFYNLSERHVWNILKYKKQMNKGKEIP